MLKKYGKNIIFFILLILLTFLFLLRGRNINDLFEALAKVNWTYIVVGVLAMFIYILCEALCIKILIKVFKHRISILDALKYSFIGFFYSSITPSSTGGQPMQIYHMKKDGIDIAHSTISFIILLTVHHLVVLAYLLIGAFCNRTYLMGNLQYFKILIILGLLVTIGLLFIYISMLFFPKTSDLFIRFVNFLVRTLKIKNPEKIDKKLRDEIKKYREGAKCLKNNKLTIFKVALLCILQMTSLFSITYFTYRALGQSGTSAFQIITLQAVLYSSVAPIPSPGSVGASEGGFLAIFKPIFGPSLINCAAIINRFVNFYIYVLIGGIISIYAYIKSQKSKIVTFK